jgi:hypothetical protein
MDFSLGYLAAEIKIDVKLFFSTDLKSEMD